jgi:hypothetical protein
MSPQSWRPSSSISHDLKSTNLTSDTKRSVAVNSSIETKANNTNRRENSKEQIQVSSVDPLSKLVNKSTTIKTAPPAKLVSQSVDFKNRNVKVGINHPAKENLNKNSNPRNDFKRNKTSFMTPSKSLKIQSKRCY